MPFCAETEKGRGITIKQRLNRLMIYILCFQEKRRLAINNAKRQWEVMQGSLIQKTSKLVRTPDLYANHVGSVPNSEVITPDNDDDIKDDESLNRYNIIPELPSS